MTQLQTHEVGSLPKPNWRVKPFKEGKTIEEQDLEEARHWGRELGVDGYEELVETLGQSEYSEDDLELIQEFSQQYAIHLQETHLDVVYDGEQTRSEMYDFVARHVDNMHPVGPKRSFDNKYYTVYAVRGPLSLDELFHVDEFEFVEEYADKPVKVPLTGPYTMADWSFNEHYDSVEEFTFAFAEEVIRPHIEALIEAGAEWIQIDEPAITTKPEEVGIAFEALNRATEGLDAKFSTHICFSDYSRLFPEIEKLENFDQVDLELANHDHNEPGTSAEDRPGYEVLEEIAERTDLAVGVGVVDIHTDDIESPELVRDRILYSVDVLGADRVNPSPDCGLRTRSWDISAEKLQAIREGTELARRELGL